MKNTINKIAICSLLMTHSITHLVAEEVVINNNGAWCWYQDERVVVQDNYLIVGSVASRVGTDGKRRGGNIEVTTYDFINGGNPRIHVMHKGLEDDDHNVPALLTLPDKRILAVYSKHNTDRKIRYRTTKVSGDLTQWNDEVAMTRKDSITYANTMRLSDQNSGKGRLYNFYRGINFNPTFDISDDNGKTWSKGTHFISNKGRPYVKYISNNKDTIHFVTTEQHPRVFDNSIYHGYLHKNNVYRSDGAFVQSINDGPVKPTDLTKVYQGGPNNVAWTVDLQLDNQGQPYTVFSVQMNDSDKKIKRLKPHGDDHRYFYAKLLKTNNEKSNSWQVNEMAYAGSRLYDKEQDYTGLVALNPQNPNKLVISTNANPKTGRHLISRTDGKRHYELFQGTTTDNGKSWTWEYLTKNSLRDNLRPFIPSHTNNELLLLWMRGNYISYTQTDTEIVFHKNPPSLGVVK